MLQTGVFKKGDIVAAKLVNGEEVVAKVHTPEDNGVLVITQPVSIIPGKEGLSFGQSFMTVSDTTLVYLRTSNVIMLAEPVTDIANAYIKATSGIEIARP
jgi:hypothetical protein